jgi:hypothetical protein
MKSNEVHAQKQELLTRIQTEGAETAYQAALEVCRDKKAPAPARATCATTILRAGGYLNAKDEGGLGKQPHEMSLDEISAQLRDLRAARGRQGENGGDTFG